jgi:hypothetical protein
MPAGGADGPIVGRNAEDDLKSGACRSQRASCRNIDPRECEQSSRDGIDHHACAVRKLGHDARSVESRKSGLKLTRPRPIACDVRHTKEKDSTPVCFPTSVPRSALGRVSHFTFGPRQGYRDWNSGGGLLVSSLPLLNHSDIAAIQRSEKARMRHPNIENGSGRRLCWTEPLDLSG